MSPTISVVLLLVCLYPLCAAIQVYDHMDVVIHGPMKTSSFNPFLDVSFNTTFVHETQTTTIEGFYDGKDHYVARFMPTVTGDFTYTTESNIPALHGEKVQQHKIHPQSSTEALLQPSQVKQGISASHRRQAVTMGSLGLSRLVLVSAMTTALLSSQ